MMSESIYLTTKTPLNVRGLPRLPGQAWEVAPAIAGQLCQAGFYRLRPLRAKEAEDATEAGLSVADIRFMDGAKTSRQLPDKTFEATPCLILDRAGLRWSRNAKKRRQKKEKE